MVGLVAAGLGVAVLPASMGQVHVEGVTYVPIDSPDAASALHLVHRRNDTSPLVKTFMALMLKA
jgi:DNA-binding transcriptional LysR family regulator